MVKLLRKASRSCGWSKFGTTRLNRRCYFFKLLLLGIISFGSLSVQALLPQVSAAAVQKSSYDNRFLCYRLIAVTAPDRFVCDIANEYPSTRLHPILKDRMGVRIRGIRTAALDARSKKERVFAEQTVEFLRAQLENAGSIELRNVRRDANFNFLATVQVDDQALKNLFLQERWACSEELAYANKRFKFKRYIKAGRLSCP